MTASSPVYTGPVTLSVPRRVYDLRARTFDSRRFPSSQSQAVYVTKETLLAPTVLPPLSAISYVQQHARQSEIEEKRERASQILTTRCCRYSYNVTVVFQTRQVTVAGPSNTNTLYLVYSLDAQAVSESALQAVIPNGGTPPPGAVCFVTRREMKGSNSPVMLYF